VKTLWPALGALRRLRERKPFAALSRAEWATFLAIASFWDGASASPSQRAIATSAGFTTRSVRDAIASLERRGVLLRMGANGASPILAPSPLTLRELQAAAVRKAGSRRAAARWEMASAARTKNTNTNTKSLSAGPRTSQGSRPADDQPRDLDGSKSAAEERAIAEAALAEWFYRSRPRSPCPSTFYPPELELVARCASAVEGDLATKLQAMADAITGAFYLSNRPPTVRYIWGTLHHFLSHVERGRSIRLAMQPQEAFVRVDPSAGKRNRPPLG
jgi:hypothetical protein